MEEDINKIVTALYAINKTLKKIEEKLSNTSNTSINETEVKKEEKLSNTSGVTINQPAVFDICRRNGVSPIWELADGNRVVIIDEDGDYPLGYFKVGDKYKFHRWNRYTGKALPSKDYPYPDIVRYIGDIVETI